jgi:hypothetical protein
MAIDARFFVTSLPAFLEVMNRWLVPLNLGDRTLHESIYFNDPLLTLHLADARTCVRRRIEPGDPDSPREARYTLYLATRARDRVPGHGETVDLETATTVLRRAFARHKLAPYLGVRFRRLRFGVPGAGTITIDHDVEHLSFVSEAAENGAAVRLGEEGHPRVHIDFYKRPDKAVLAALDAVPRLPHMSKRWMGYFFTERNYKQAMKRVNELPGYEYEIKLDAEHLDIDVNCLPFPIHRVYQSQCVRRYYDGYRVSFRLARATMARKGDVELIDGVPRRTEQKQKELSAWTLPASLLEMRRIKKTYLLINPHSQRTYNLCLDLCLSESDQEMCQIEIEYIGTLSPTPTLGSREAEKAVTTDMLQIRDRLMARYGFRETDATKRDFVRKLAGGAV